MDVELSNLPSGDVEIRVCSGGLCGIGWVTSHHLVGPKQAQLEAMVRREQANDATPSSVDVAA